MAASLISLLIEEPRFTDSPNESPESGPEELGALYTAHYRDILQLCQRFFRQREDAEDAAAEVFLKLHRVLNKRDPAMPFRPWLWQVARRHCIDKIRQRKVDMGRRAPETDVCEVADGFSLSPLSELLKRERQRQVREQLNRLPEHYKVPLVLRYYKQMSYTEIAGALDRRLPAVRTMIFRAKNQLRANLGLLGGPRMAGLED
jgi:RNA polymerase sigma-70 factor (ECF subfamily)